MTQHTNGSAAAASSPAINGETSRFKTPLDQTSDHDAFDSRPSTALGRKNGVSPAETKDDMEPDRPRRPVKPTLQRSKSDYVPRQQQQQQQQQDGGDNSDDEIQEWGARHGFEDHYQSEHIITQLASVSTTPCTDISCIRSRHDATVKYSFMLTYLLELVYVFYG